jgi:hypothetical protein
VTKVWWVLSKRAGAEERERKRDGSEKSDYSCWYVNRHTPYRFKGIIHIYHNTFLIVGQSSRFVSFPMSYYVHQLFPDPFNCCIYLVTIVVCIQIISCQSSVVLSNLSMSLFYSSLFSHLCSNNPSLTLLGNRCGLADVQIFHYVHLLHSLKK